VPDVASTRRLALATAAGGLLFGATTAVVTSIEVDGLPTGAAVLTGLGAAIAFGGSMFLLLYLGYVRPRQLDPGPARDPDRRPSVSERLWGDGRPPPVWLRRSMYGAAVFFVVLALGNVWIVAVSSEARPVQIVGAVTSVGFAALTYAVARRGERPRPPLRERPVED
jgi:hypothetical protein